MINQFLDTAHTLSEHKEAYAMVFVVNRQIPSSGKPGDKAIVHQDGTITGWIGGGCTRGIVLKEAALAIQSGKPRLVKISPEGKQESTPGVKHYPMTCHSGGMVELFIEPIMPAPSIIIMGKSHVAMALNGLSQAMGYNVTAISKGADEHIFPGAKIFEAYEDDMIGKDSFVVVCTQGENDELALLQAAHSSAQYIGFVASRKKANAVFQYMREHGISIDRLKGIKTPAGLDINAKTPHEVAVSILSEIIQTFRDEASTGEVENVTLNNDKIYINPVCGVPVEKATAKHVINYKDKDVYFCCDGCKVQFEAEPDKYMAKA